MGAFTRDEAAAVATLGAVIADLSHVADRLKSQPGQAETAARTLERLAEEISEAARMLRTADPSAASGPDAAAPQA